PSYRRLICRLCRRARTASRGALPAGLPLRRNSGVPLLCGGIMADVYLVQARLGHHDQVYDRWPDLCVPDRWYLRLAVAELGDLGLRAALAAIIRSHPYRPSQSNSLEGERS